MDANSPAWPARWPLLAAVGLALLAAAVQYALFLPEADTLWRDPIHDRNAHYFFGLSLALDVRQFDIVGLVRDLNHARIWPPAHGVVLAGVLTATGFDPRFAVLPSLLAWAGLLVGVFVLAWRLCPSGGVLAGFAAMLFTLASPIHRAFATDVMLESLGTCLSLWAIERYIAVRQRPTLGGVRSFALVLLALFLTKYNYWALVVAGIVAAELLTRPGESLAAGRQFLASLPRGWQGWAEVPPAVRVLLVWFVVPVAVWFCLPGRLSAFLWYGLAAHGETLDRSLASRMGKFAGWIQGDYHAHVALLAGIGVLVLTALVLLRRLRVGSLVVVLFLGLACGLTLTHPNCKSRFLMSWMPALWVLAGAGLALVVPRRGAWPGLTVALIAVICLPAAWTPGRADEAGTQPGAPSLLPLAEAYLPYVQPDERTAVLATVPMKFFTQWSYLQAQRPRRDRDLEGKGWLHLEVPDLAAFEAWLERTRCEKVVVLEVAPGSPFAMIPPGWNGDSVLSQWQATQHRFTVGQTWTLAEVGTSIRVFQSRARSERQRAE